MALNPSIPSSHTSFSVPLIYSAKVLRNFLMSTIYELISNTDYEK